MALLELLRAHPFLAAIGLLLSLAYGYHILLVKSVPPEPPLTKGYIPFLGVAPQAMWSTLALLRSCKAKYGDIFTIYALGRRITFVADPIDGVSAVFKQPKQLSFLGMLRRVDIIGFGISAERADNEAMNKEHFQTRISHLLGTSAVEGLTDRFGKFLLQYIRDEVTKDSEYRTGKTIDLFDWCGGTVFYVSGSALFGDGIFDGDHALEDFEKFDAGFALRLVLPTWMTQKFVNARESFRDMLATKFAQGLSDPSELIKCRIEVTSRTAALLTLGSTQIRVWYGDNWKRHNRSSTGIVGEFSLRDRLMSFRRMRGQSHFGIWHLYSAQKNITDL